MITFKEYAKGKKKKYPNALCCRTKDKPKDYSKLPKGSGIEPGAGDRYYKRLKVGSAPLNTVQKAALFLPAVQAIIGRK